jgi:hypothetical protein
LAKKLSEQAFSQWAKIAQSGHPGSSAVAGSAWHLIVGGADGTDMEAFNYNTNAKCKILNKLPNELAG